jgi:hypothetical protein
MNGIGIFPWFVRIIVISSSIFSGIVVRKRSAVEVSEILLNSHS